MELKVREVEHREKLEQYLKEHQEHLKNLDENAVQGRLGARWGYFRERGKTPVAMFENQPLKFTAYYVQPLVSGLGRPA